MSNRFRIKPADTFIWNQNELLDFLIAHQGNDIVIENGTEGCCAHTVGLYQYLDKFDFKSVTIETSNVLETHPRYLIKLVLPWKFLHVKTAIEDQYHDWNKAFVFGTLFGRPLWHRLGIAAHLYRHHGLISKVGLVADPKNQDRRELFEISQLWYHSPSSFFDFAALSSQLPLIHSSVEQYTPGATLTDGYVSQTKQCYRDFFVDVVAETFTSGNCFFITEKTVRPMLLKKPFIVFGAKDYLLYLRQMGFRTFGDFWNEDYDGYTEGDRYVRILSLIDELASRSVKELEQMHWDMQYTLDHNYQLLQQQKYSVNISTVQ